MSEKERLSATVDAELLAAARAAVEAGRAVSVSAWVNRALLRERDHDERLRALETLIADYEGKNGGITDQEIRDAKRRIDAKSISTGSIARGPKAKTKRGVA